MIDYIFRYADEAEAKADAEVLASAMGGQAAETWQLQYTIPNIKAWRPSQDTTEVVPPTETMPESERVVHNYLSGWWVLVATEAEEPVLLDAQALEFALDRGTSQVIKIKSIIPAEDMAFEPAFAGSKYPIGSYEVRT